jgi:hypothetical protein
MRSRNPLTSVAHKMAELLGLIVACDTRLVKRAGARHASGALLRSGLAVSQAKISHGMERHAARLRGVRGFVPAALD